MGVSRDEHFATSSSEEIAEREASPEITLSALGSGVLAGRGPAEGMSSCDMSPETAGSRSFSEFALERADPGETGRNERSPSPTPERIEPSYGDLNDFRDENPESEDPVSSSDTDVSRATRISVEIGVEDGRMLHAESCVRLGAESMLGKMHLCVCIGDQTTFSSHVQMYVDGSRGHQRVHLTKKCRFFNERARDESELLVPIGRILRPCTVCLCGVASKACHLYDR